MGIGNEGTGLQQEVRTQKEAEKGTQREGTAVEDEGRKTKGKWRQAIEEWGHKEGEEAEGDGEGGTVGGNAREGGDYEQRRVTR